MELLVGERDEPVILVVREPTGLVSGVQRHWGSEALGMEDPWKYEETRTDERRYVSSIYKYFMLSHFTMMVW